MNIPVFYSSNYSLGLFKLIQILKSSDLNHLEATIEETHHVHKKDAPSGTSLMLKDKLSVQTEIKSIREGDVFGVHTLFYKLDGETLSFTHTAESREIFAKGAISALNFLLKQPAGLYGMEELLSKDNNKS